MPLPRFLTDASDSQSLAIRCRRRRFAIFERLIAPLARPVKILDAGGTESFWETMGLTDPNDVEVLLLNTAEHTTRHPNFRSIAGDARDLGRFGDRQFDVVFSNSVIEHVGGPEDQRRMANEIRRVGRRYFVQTPNFWFPMEPHFLFPCFQYLPRAVRVWLVQHFSIGIYERLPERARAERAVEEFRLLGHREFSRLFPNATICRERFCGLTKSLVAYEIVAPCDDAPPGPEDDSALARVEATLEAFP
jgi:hypothetical protein